MFLLFFCAVGIGNHSCIAQKDNWQKQEQFIKDFYSEYLTKTNLDEYSSKAVRQNYRKIMNSYCTKSLVDRITQMQESYELSHDPFLNAQDYHISILDFLLVKRNSKKENSYCVSYRYKNQNENERIYVEIQVIETDRGFKISGVDNIN